MTQNASANNNNYKPSEDPRINHYLERIRTCQARIVYCLEQSEEFKGFEDFVSYYLNSEELNKCPDMDVHKPQYFSTFLGGMWFIHCDLLQICVSLDAVSQFLLVNRVILQAIETILALTTNEEVVRCYYEKLTLAEFYRLAIKIPSYI